MRARTLLSHRGPQILRPCQRLGHDQWLGESLNRHGYTRLTRQYTRDSNESLRILFCGSDEFSVSSLRAIHDEKRSGSGLIESIDVLYRPAKRTGRGMKELTYPAIHHECLKLHDIRAVHHVDTFKGWLDQPTDIDLIIAVSFGLLVPSNIIRGARHGGLNVHPSLLPDLPGAAPIQHTLLNRRSHTGVTVQTLHTTKFDAGVRLAQTPLPGIAVPDIATTQSMIPLLAEEGSRLLLDVLRSGIYRDVGNRMNDGLSTEQIAAITDGNGLAKASKLTKNDARIDWAASTAGEILLKLRVFGTVWCELSDEELVEQSDNMGAGSSSTKMRINIHEMIQESQPRHGDGSLWTAYTEEEGFPMRTVDGVTVLMKRCTVAGGRRGKGVQALRSRARSLGV